MTRIGGSIYAANRPEGGAVFNLSFPLAHAKSTRAAPKGSSKVPSRCVLVIDDDLPNLQAFSDLLESKCQKVVRARSGPEALEILLNSDSQIDVVFCDLGMPLVNGWQIAQRAKSLAVPPAFYLVTGWGAEIPGDDPRRRLVDAVIAKPIDPRILDRLLVANNNIKIGSQAIIDNVEDARRGHSNRPNEH